MSSEWREERCGDCGTTRDRRWVVQTHKTRTAMPKGFRVASRGVSGTWNLVEGPTRDVTLCLCDTSY